MTGIRLHTPARSPTGPTLGSRLLALLNRDLSLPGRRKRPSDRQKEALYVEVGTLLGAGLDIKTVLDLQVQQHRPPLRDTLGRIRDAVVQGSTVSAAFQATGQFTPYEYHSLHIGEETGRLPEILRELARYYTRQIKQRRQLTQALAYPVLVLSTAVGAVGFMLNFIVPMFSDVFRRFGGDLPPLTQFVVGLSTVARQYAWPALLGVVGLVIGLRLLRRSPTYRLWLSHLLLRIPILGQLVRRVYLGRLCGALSLLMGAHVPLLQSLELARQMIGFAPLTHALAAVEAQVMKGAPLHTSLAAFGALFDARALALVKVGEEVNKLGYFFGLLSQQYSEEVDHRASLLSSALEPLIIVFLGLVVGLILVAMYLPIFQMSSAIG